MQTSHWSLLFFQKFVQVLWVSKWFWQQEGSLLLGSIIYFHLFNFDALRLMGSPFSGLKRVPIYSTVASGISSLVKCNQICTDSKKTATSAIGILVFVGIFTNSVHTDFIRDLYKFVLLGETFSSKAKSPCHCWVGESFQDSKMYIFKRTHAVSTCLARSFPTIYFRVASLDRSFFGLCKNPSSPDFSEHYGLRWQVFLEMTSCHELSMSSRLVIELLKASIQKGRFPSGARGMVFRSPIVSGVPRTLGSAKGPSR